MQVWVAVLALIAAAAGGVLSLRRAKRGAGVWYVLAAVCVLLCIAAAAYLLAAPLLFSAID